MTEPFFDDAPEPAALRAALTEPDPSLRRLAVIAAADFADEAPALFVAAAADPDPGVRLEAARALEASPDPGAVAALGKLLTDEDDEVRRAAAESLGEILDETAAPLLLPLLAAAETPFARAALLAALRKLRAADALQPALNALADENAAVRREAAGVLAYLRNDAALAPLAERLAADADDEVRRVVAGALGFSDAPTAAAALAAALRDPDWQVREAAAATLTKLAPSSALSDLIAAVADANWQVAVKAAAALGRIADPAAAPARAALDCWTSPARTRRAACRRTIPARRQNCRATNRPG